MARCGHSRSMKEVDHHRNHDRNSSKMGNAHIPGGLFRCVLLSVGQDERTKTPEGSCSGNSCDVNDVLDPYYLF